MSSKDLNFAGEAVFEAINNQIQNNAPPQTKQTYDRLMKAIKNHDASRGTLLKIVTLHL